MRLIIVVLPLLTLATLSCFAQEAPQDLKRRTIRVPASAETQRDLIADSTFRRQYLQHNFQLDKEEALEIKGFDKLIQQNERSALWETTVKSIIVDQDEQLQQTEAMIANPNENEAVLKPRKPFLSVFELHELNIDSPRFQNVLKNAINVLVMVPNQRLIRSGTGYAATSIRNLCSNFGLCPDEPFCDQPVLGLGTAFLVRNDVILTAAHNVKNTPVKNIRFLLGFKNLPSGAPKLYFEKGEIFHAKSLFSSELLSKFDLCLIKLDRRVTQLPIRIKSTNQINAGDKLYMLGYPLGLPLKYATNGSIRSINSRYSFNVSLDAYQGNSGSPVFDERTHELLGVLVSGGIDFQSNGNCNSSKLYTEENYKGDRVIAIMALQDEIDRVLSMGRSR